VAFYCDNCKLNFRKKPTYTTTCPVCGQGLTRDEYPYPGYPFYGEGIVHDRCGWCTERIREPSRAFTLLKPQYISEGGLRSDKIHKKCYRKTQKLSKDRPFPFSKETVEEQKKGFLVKELEK